MLKVWKKSWEPFGSCLLNSTANPAHFHPSLAGLAVLFSRQLPNGSDDFFQTFSIVFLNYFIKNPQTTIALPFLTHNISAIGGVHSYLQSRVKYLVRNGNSFEVLRAHFSAKNKATQWLRILNTIVCSPQK